MKFLFYIFIGVIFLYIIGAGYLYVTQDEKVFNKKYSKYYTPKNIEPIYFKTSDGIVLEGGIVKNKRNGPLILYFSGNANNVFEFLEDIGSKLKNYNFVAFNYPGYGNSEGKPCESCILKYALEIYDKYKPDIVIGRSLGSAAASFCAKRNPKGIILITPFDSIENIAKIKYPFFPVSFLLKYKFDEAKFISKTNSPVVVIALKNDDVIPKQSLNNLLVHIKNLKEVIYLDGVMHGLLYTHPKIVKTIQKAINDLKENNEI